MINKDYAYIPLQGADYATKLPLDFLTKAMGQLQERSDRNYVASQELPGLLNVPVDEADFQRRAEIQKSVQDRINQTIAKYDGNLSNASKDVYALQAHVKGLLAPSGQIGAMSSNYSQLKDYQKQILEDKTLSGSEKNQAIAFSRSRFKELGGTGEINPITGQYNVFSGHRLTGFDMQKYLKDFTKIDPMLQEKTGTTYDAASNSFRDIHTSEKINDPRRISAILKAGLASSTDFKEWARGRAQMGMNVSEDTVDQAIQAEANARAFGEYKEDVDYRWNKMTDYNLEREKFNYKKSRDAKKDAEETAANGLSWSYTGIDAATKGYTLLDVKDLDKIKTGEEIGLTRSYMEGGGYNKAAAIYSGVKDGLDYNHPVAKNNEDLKRSMEAIARQVAKQKGINFDAMDPNQKNDYFQKLDKENRDSFRGMVTNDYNTRVKNIAERTTGQVNITSEKHSRMVANSIMLQANSLPVFDNTDIHVNGASSQGHLLEVIQSAGGKVEDKNGKLDKKGDYYTRAVGVNPDGTINLNVSIYDGNKTVSHIYRVPNRNQGQMDVYKENVSIPFSKAGTKDKPIFDPILGKSTYQVQTLNIRDSNNNFIDLGEEKTSNGNDRILKMDDIGNLSTNQVYFLDDGSYLDGKTIKPKTMYSATAKVYKNGKMQEIELHSKRAVLEQAAGNDPIFKQNLDSKYSKENEEDSNEFK